MIKPISLKTKLSSPLLNQPLYSKELKAPLSQEKLEVADPQVVRALVALMDMQAVLGGAASHFGGPSALAEINSVLYALAFKEGDNWAEKFNLVNDAGHCENGLYALKALYEFADLKVEDLKGFRSIESKLTGHGESHLFPEGVLLSNGPLGSSVAQAQGLAMADALADKKRHTILTLSDGGAMEGEAREALASIPGLAKKSKLAPFILVISDNNTKLSARIDQDSFSMEPTFKSLGALGWKVYENVDGHDLEKVTEVFEKALQESSENPQQPVAIQFKTIKGKGHQASEESASGGHGFPLKKVDGLRSMVEEILAGQESPKEVEAWLAELEEASKAKASQAVPSSSSLEEVKKEKIQVGLAQAFLDLKAEGYPLVSVSSDLYGSTGMAAFRKAYPDSSFDMGIAESNMLSVGAGFSKMGYIPVVDTFSQFGVTKGALPLTMANLSQSPVICVFSHTGFQDAADGASHQALSYYAMLSSIPETDVISLSCSSEAYALVSEVVKEFKQTREAGRTPRSTVFFLGRENFPQYYKKDASYSKNSEVVYSAAVEGQAEAVILTTGSLVPQALKAQTTLKEAGVLTKVVSKSFINGRLSSDFKDLLEKSKGRLLVLEDHQKISGFGAHVLAQVTEEFGSDSLKAFKALAVQGEFGRSAYTAQELYSKYGIDAAAVVKTVKSWI